MARADATSSTRAGRTLEKLRSFATASAVIATFADYFGLALLTPALPFYLSEIGISEQDVPVWNGIITTSQFAAIVIGNLVWGSVIDRCGSMRALQLAMAGDTVFFALSAAAPFGLRGSTAGYMLTCIRFCAGLFTPLVSAIVFIFDRVATPAAIVRGMGHYALAIITAYGLAGMVVGLLYDVIGWGAVNALSAAVAGLAFGYVSLCSAPPISLDRPRPEGVGRALRTADFATHAWTAFCCGYSMNCCIFMLVILLKENFGWTPRAVGFFFLSIPAIMLPVNMAVLPRLANKHGFHRLITAGGIVACAAYSLQAIWASRIATGDEQGVVPLLILFMVTIIALMFKQNCNQARGKTIADKYAKNARGAVTSQSRNAFAIGQAISPVISGVLYTEEPFLPFIVVTLLLAANLGLFVLLGVPLLHDGEPAPGDGARVAPSEPTVQKASTGTASQAEAGLRPERKERRGSTLAILRAGIWSTR